MDAVKRRKLYLEGVEDINYSAKYRSRKKIEGVGETLDEALECKDDKEQNDHIPLVNPNQEPCAISTSYADASSDNDIGSDDEEFNSSLIRDNQPKNLQDLLQSPGFCDNITTPVERSPAELLLMTLKFSVTNQLPLTSTSDLTKLINSTFAMPVLPESRYLIDKFCNSIDNAEFHATCPNCTMYIGILTELNQTAKCTNCNAVIDVVNSSSTNCFAIIDPSDAVADYLNAYEDHYSYIMQERRYEKGHFRDVYDGKLYRNFVSSLPETVRQQYATVVFNTDGAPVFECSTYSIWPIYIMINELPAERRSDHLIVCGLWFGKSKPQMNVFLDPFVEKMNELSSTGISCSIKGATLNVKLYALICCVDTIARSPMNGMMQFNAFFGCDWCLHPGEWIDGSMRYSILNHVVENRDSKSTINHMEEAVRKELPIFGVRNATPLINLDCFDCIEGFVPDHLHCWLLGVTKQLTESTIKSISAAELRILELRLSQIRAPNQLGRLTRPLKDRAHWKAREWENWLLYYSIPVYELVIDRKKLKHWSLLVESLHLLLGTDITSKKLDNADRMLHEFVCGVEELYSKTAMTYNVHQLLHIARSVYNWGPLWAHSTFPFESGNHKLLSAIQCAKGVNHQILRYLNMNRSIDVLERYLYTHSSDTVEQYCSGFAKSRTKKCLQINGITFFGSTYVVNKPLLDKFQLSPNTIISMRIVKNGCLYASCEKKNLRSCNSYAQLANKNYIQIIKFVVDQERNKQLVLCNLLQTTSSEFAETLKKVTRIHTEVIAVNVTDIDKVCVLLNATDVQYIMSVPNLYKY